jgi:hypothetical protein
MELIVVAVCIREIAIWLHFVSQCNNGAFDTLRYKRLYIGVSHRRRYALRLTVKQSVLLKV